MSDACDGESMQFMQKVLTILNLKHISGNVTRSY